jgi:hypothetical protein
VGGVPIVGRVVVEAETPDAARVTAEPERLHRARVNRDSSDQPVSF